MLAVEDGLGILLSLPPVQVEWLGWLLLLPEQIGAAPVHAQAVPSDVVLPAASAADTAEDLPLPGKKIMGLEFEFEMAVGARG